MGKIRQESEKPVAEPISEDLEPNEKRELSEESAVRPRIITTTYRPIPRFTGGCKNCG